MKMLLETQKYANGTPGDGTGCGRRLLFSFEICVRLKVVLLCDSLLTNKKEKPCLF